MSASLIINVPPMVDGPQLLGEIEAITGERPSVRRDGARVELTFEGEFDSLVVQDAVDSHIPSNLSQMDQLVTKAEQVWGGQGSFTNAQIQKIVAGLVLVVARYLR